MATNAAWLEMDEPLLVHALQGVVEKLDSAQGEVLLDFSAVHRINAGALQAMEKLAAMADAKAVKVVLRGVNVSVYKVLTLTKLARRFRFLS